MNLNDLRQLRAEKARTQARNDLTALLRQPEFLRWLERFVFDTGVFSGTFRNGDGTAMAFLEGRREVGRMVLSECGAASQVALGNLATMHFRRLALEAEEDSKASPE